MAALTDVAVVEAALTGLAARADGPFVTRLPREPGRRDSRYAHLFSSEVVASAHTAEPDAAAVTLPATRLERIEQELRQLRTELDALKARLGN
jgi:uncharacterized protein YceH (UPF0502 family)